MNVAIPFKLNYKLNDKIQEFDIFFDPNKNNLDTLIEFIQQFKDKQINIEYRNGIDIKSAAALSKIGDNVRFRLRAEDITKTRHLQERGCKFFFDNSMAATDWVSLYYQVEVEGVSEVYLADSLMYELDRVSMYCHKHNVKTRLVINRVPLTRPVKPDMWFAPFFRPQDYDVVDTWFDTIEFDCGDPVDTDKLNVLYRAYIEKKDWYGRLEELNPDASIDVPCRGIVPQLVDKRAVCGLRCLKGGKCRTCRNVITLGQDLRDISVQLQNA